MKNYSVLLDTLANICNHPDPECILECSCDDDCPFDDIDCVDIKAEDWHQALAVMFTNTGKGEKE